jgi:N-alpha-acetyltransferase 10/11
MTASITLVADTGQEDTKPARVPVRPLASEDFPEIASLHQYAYAGGEARPRDGDLGRIGGFRDVGRGGTVEAASLIASGPGGRITAVIIIVERDGEAVIEELFTHPDHRRRGLAEELLRHSMHALHTQGRTTVTVTVDENNPAALALYLSRDFRRLTDDDPDYDYD